MRVSPNDQRKLPVSQVAVIDYVGGAQGLPETETGPARGADHVMVMRNSQVVPGHLVDIEGGAGSDKPDDRRVYVFRTTGGEERRVAAEQVGRVYLGQFPAAQAGHRAAQQHARDAGIGVGRSRSGQPALDLDRHPRQRGADGHLQRTGRSAAEHVRRGSRHAGWCAGGRRAPDRAPLPSALAGALIGRIGNGAPFGIGNQTLVPMPATGELFLGVNDDEVGDNSGGFVVDVRPQAVPRRR